MEINLAQLKGSCECGRNHAITTKTIIMEPGAINRILDVTEALEIKSMGCIICDTNTKDFAEAVALKISANLYIHKPVIVLQADGLEASDKCVQEAEAEISPYVSWLAAVGSGTVHTITRFLANKMKIPFVSVPTAAATDGFAGTVNTMSWNGYIKTFTGVAPLAVFADNDIFLNAPYRLTAAGISETLSKYMSLADWKCGNIFLNEPFCERVYELVKTAVDSVFENLPAIHAGDAEACETLMLSLLMAGISMQMWGDSRPVSGGERQLVQFWDMCVVNKKPNALQGEKIGVGLLTALRHCEKALQIANPERKMLGYEGMPQSVMKSKFGPMYESVLKENQPDPLKSVTPEIMLEKFPELQKIISSIPSARKLRPHMQAAGCMTKMEDIGLDSGIIPDSLMLAPFVRRRFTVMRVLKLLKI